MSGENRKQRMLYAIGIGLLIGLLLATMLDPWLALASGVAVALVLAFWPAKRLAQHLGGGHDPAAALLLKARGDKALVERLIRYEQSRKPDGTRTEWAQDALDRWNRDR
jgi:hypothetical protein